MVNTGKPSQGCGTCRARRIKCDERKPTCFRCQKSKRECTGYRNQLFLRRLGSGKSDAINWQQIPNSNQGDLYKNDWSKCISKITYRSVSPPETIILSPPTYGISVSVEEEALCHFIDSFVLMPCKGNSRSYMDFIIPAMKDEKSLTSPKTSLNTAIMAVSMASFGNQRRHQHVLGKAAKLYAKALQQINEALLDPELALEDQTLATVIILGLFEAFTGTNTQLVGWSSHAEGAAMLVKMRAQKKHLSRLGHILHVMARSQLVVNCFVSSTPPPLGVGWWMQMGTRDGIPCQIARLNLETATLHAKANDVLAEAAINPETDNIIEVQTMAQDLELKFKDWENSLDGAWTFSSVAWIDDVDDSQLEHSPSFPGRLDEYRDISIATAWCMMRANRIMLGAGIVRANAWLHPEEDYRITPEYATTARISKDLIEDIIAAVPTFLGKVPDVMTRGRTPEIQREALGGKSSLALFIMWPLFIISMSDHATDQQRKWVLGRLKVIAEEVGIHQASLFTQLTIRVPSMFIYKDQVAKEEGNAVAKEKCLEMALSKSKGIGREAEHVLAGILGCK
ncbi:hypothetical protein N431DRAFT_375686 [Stipitochalara longipes BDJ]|nr:hypothetical protein N431DRAFT_375686 [Stipitochalara longipes BDJ]